MFIYRNYFRIERIKLSSITGSFVGLERNRIIENRIERRNCDTFVWDRSGLIVTNGVTVLVYFVYYVFFFVLVGNSFTHERTASDNGNRC